MKKTVLLTGISGFVGQHCAVELIRKGYAVKGTVRNLSKKKNVLDAIRKEVGTLDDVEVLQLDLIADAGWDDAMTGVEYVLHVASPFTLTEPKDEMDMIRPAVDGTLRVLKSARTAGVKKVVLTSSTVAMAGDAKMNHLTQESWTNPESDRVSAYTKSKALAEKAAWKFYKSQQGGERMELTVIHPGPIFGPTLSGDLTGASMTLMRDLLTGKLAMQPNVHYPMSDVRDVAALHVAALENKESDGQRFIVTSEEPYSFVEIASLLKENGYGKVRPRKAPSALIRFLSLFNREMKGMVPMLDVRITCDVTPAKRVFGWRPMAIRKTVLDTAASITPRL